MAKMYYTQEETLKLLNCTEDELRAMVRERQLREFRDAGKINYRADEVDALVRGRSQAGGEELKLEESGELGLAVEGSGEIPLAPADEGPVSGSGTLGGSDAPVDVGGSGSVVLSLEDSAGELALEDSTAAAPPARETKSRVDTGDALSLEEVDQTALEGMKKDDTVITNIGISVFDDEDLEISADPMAKTVLTGGEEGILDGSAAGGSGLLDLTRINDETSLGRDLLEEIDLGGSGEAAAPKAEPAQDQAAEAEVLPEPEPELAGMPMTPGLLGVATVPAASPAYTGLLIAAAVTLTLCGAMAIAVSMQAWPSYLNVLAQQFWFFLLGTFVLGGLGAGIGYLVGKQATAGPKPPKPKKEKARKGKKGRQEESSVEDQPADVELLEEPK